MAPLRARIFVDFWNLQLNINENKGSSYRLDWTKISPFLVTQSEALTGTSLHFEETIVYLSYDPQTSHGRGLRNWAINVLDHFPGIRVIDKARKAKHPPVCTNCHKTITHCPHCSVKLKGTVEKGIDTAIVTDMISLAWANAWDVAILISSDRDYIPYLNRWIQPDTIIPDFANPPSFNRYSYVNNRPLNFVDPNGHSLWRDPGKLYPEHWRYHAVYNRLRRWPWQPKDPELSMEESRNYPRGSMLASMVGIAVGLLLLILYLTE